MSASASSSPSSGFNIGVVGKPQIGRAKLGLTSERPARLHRGALKPPPGCPRCCFCCCFEAPNTEFSEQFPGILLGLARATAEGRRCSTIFTLRDRSRYFRRGGGQGTFVRGSKTSNDWSRESGGERWNPPDVIKAHKLKNVSHFRGRQMNHFSTSNDRGKTFAATLTGGSLARS